MKPTKTLDVVIPVYNEQKILEKTINTLHAFLSESMSEYAWKIVIADNASKDNTLVIAKSLSANHPQVSFIHLDQKGRGRALRKAWSESKADIRTYMDVDLSTALTAFPPLVKALATEYDIATGTRLEEESHTKRSLFRETLSRGYNLLVKVILCTKYSDAQCGFKGITKQAAEELIPQVKDNEWFFDTELLTLGEKQGYKLYEIPVVWVEDTDSRVRIVKTVVQYLRDLLRFRIDLLRGAARRKKPVLHAGSVPNLLEKKDGDTAALCSDVRTAAASEDTGSRKRGLTTALGGSVPHKKEIRDRAIHAEKHKKSDENQQAMIPDGAKQ